MISLLYKITGNQNGSTASTQKVEIYNVRYVKIQSTEAIDFCIRIELCGIGKYTCWYQKTMVIFMVYFNDEIYNVQSY